MAVADRLSPFDLSFLELETDTAHMHVGWLLRFEGAPPPLAALRRHIAGRLDRVPRFRRRVVAGAGLLDPVWADDTRFDVAHHVHAVRLAAPGSGAELRALAGTLLSQRLDRRLPLWRMYLVRGLAPVHDRPAFALVGQAHHALVDGVAAVEVASLLLDLEPVSAPASSGRWQPAPPPGTSQLAVRTLAERLRRGRSAARAGLRAARQGPREATAGLLEAGAAAVEAAYPPAPPSRLGAPLCARRELGLAEFDLATAKAVGAAHGATVNDVVLAMASLALARHGRRHDDTPPWLKAMVPVSTRADGTAEELGNRISFMWVALPQDERDPALVLGRIAAQTREHKRAASAATLDGLLEAAGWLPGPARRGVARFTSRPETFNLVVSNVPGPQVPLYLLGRRLSSAFPAVPLAERHALSLGVLSYCGRLHATLYADTEAVRDVDDLTRDLTSAFDALRASHPSGTEPPWRRRAGERRAAGRRQRAAATL